MKHYVKPIAGGGFVGSINWLGYVFGVFQQTPERDRLVALRETRQETTDTAMKLDTAA